MGFISHLSSRETPSLGAMVSAAGFLAPPALPGRERGAIRKARFAPRTTFTSPIRWICGLGCFWQSAFSPSFEKEIDDRGSCSGSKCAAGRQAVSFLNDGTLWTVLFVSPLACTSVDVTS